MKKSKIVAASLAAILAASSVSVVSFAAKEDYDYYITGFEKGAEVCDYKLSLNSVTSAGKAYDLSSYKEIKAGIWEAKDLIKEVSSAKISVSVEGSAREYSKDQLMKQIIDQYGEISYVDLPSNVSLPKLASGVKIVIGTDCPDYEELNEQKLVDSDKIEIIGIMKDGKFTETTHILLGTANDFGLVGQKEEALWTKVDEMIGKEDIVLMKGSTDADPILNAKLNSTDVEVKVAALKTGLFAEDEGTLDTNWIDVTARPLTLLWGNNALNTLPTTGQALGPITLKPKFELDANFKLVRIDETVFTTDMEMVVPSATFNTYIAGKYTVGAFDMWDQNVWTIPQGDPLASLDGAALGLVSSTAVPGKTNFAALAITNHYLSQPEKINVTHENLYINKFGFIDVGYGGDIDPVTLAALNNGGTVTFELENDIPADSYLIGNMFYNTATLHQFAVPLDSSAKYQITGNKITFDFPAGLTYCNDNLNSYNTFQMSWDIILNCKHYGYNGELWENGQPEVPAHEDFKIIAVGFKANGSAPTKPGDESKPGTDTSGDNNSQAGETSGDTNKPADPDKNPPTGIAFGVAPILLAGAATLVVVSKKKRK